MPQSSFAPVRHSSSAGVGRRPHSRTPPAGLGIAPLAWTSLRRPRGDHLLSRFIMKYTSGSTRGSAHTIVAIDKSTWSRRR
jgi:hypothetical protein